jgi:transposase
VIDAVVEMDLSAFYSAYRADGHGRAAYEPAVMVALVLYAFAGGQRSSRAIERHCRQDVAYRVITGNLVPDHATIARFVCRHERALADLFGEVLKQLSHIRRQQKSLLTAAFELSMKFCGMPAFH